ncbi:mRNA turnover protein 4-like [Vitis vinifera]|uniref:Ribosome assembly factor mrt4 n=1 Tax=Vitis vinifera TaxID=29760 RepID=A0A438H9P8_VITVI|nr:mRNA turnover protein 4-like [Vitis vinifera]
MGKRMWGGGGLGDKRAQDWVCKVDITKLNKEAWGVKGGGLSRALSLSDISSIGGMASSVVIHQGIGGGGRCGLLMEALEELEDGDFLMAVYRRGPHKVEMQCDLPRFFLGSNKVMQIAIGRSVADEIRPGLRKVSKLLHGDTGLFFTNLPKEEVQRLFNEYEEYDFARTGSTAVEKVELKEGPLDQFTHEMEPFLRKQGMPVRLNKGVVELVSDFVVCEEGTPLSPESARILRLLGIKMATFRLHLVCRWSPDEFDLYKEGLDDSDVESS